ncbi:hypothetical protein BRADI_5g18580v3 [Brachypodium distachyon]|uniref:F-box domain-containing protein n=1 Tax=Brachypodium distachyon TaxID=15368 RepID=I1J0P0_BRADI|nr:hypothetical protein BRADI_5g18580v3 [Brachypodium distachyon]
MEPLQRSAEETVKKPKILPVASLGDDPLGEILLRLPDMASLASAALVCKSWGQLACLPAIFRRFLSLRKPPLVGFILTNRSDKPHHCPDYSFISAKSGNPNLTSATADGDFLFHDLDLADADEGYYDDGWRLRGCNGGLLLLSRGSDALDLAVYDPIARTAVFFHAPLRLFSHLVRYAIIVDEADASFRVIAIDTWMNSPSALFSSRTHKWVIVYSYVLHAFYPCRTDGMAAGRFVYWRSDTKKSPYDSKEEKILMLDMETTVWSVIKAPVPPGESYCIADMAEHGGLCIVSSKEQRIKLWVRNNNDEWRIKKEVLLMREFGHLKDLHRDEWMKRVRILAMKAGYVYMEFWSKRKPHSYFLVLNLNTMKLEMFHNSLSRPFRGPRFPFFMLLSPLPAPEDDKELQTA